MKVCYVYIMGSRTGTLYTGITSNLVRRVCQHKDGTFPGFTSRYKVHRLLYFETLGTPKAAIAREKQIKSYRREKKTRLIDSINPRWQDLSAEWFESAGLNK